MTNVPPSLIGSHPEVIENFLRKFFRSLDQEGVVWAVAHGWEGLPRYARHDVDLLVLPRSLNAVVKALKHSAQETGWVNYGHFRSSNLHSYWILLPGDEISYFQIDIFTESSLRGTRFFRKETVGVALMKRWWNEKASAWCLRRGYAGASVLLKELIANGRVEGLLRYEQIGDAIENDGDHFCELLLDACQSKNVVDAIVGCCKERRWGELNKYASVIRQSVFRFRFSNLIGQVRYIYDYFRLRFFPYMRCFVALVGPDGCGKTTIADALVRHFDHRPLCGIMRLHSHFGSAIRLRDIKQTIYSFFGRNLEFSAEPPPGTRGMGMLPPLSCFRSMVYILYYGLQLAMGRFVLWKWRTFSSLVLADRYYYDYYYMRGHMKSPKWWKDIVWLIVPKPDIVLVLERPAEEIFAQKPELEIEEIRRQQTAIRECLDGRRGVHFIDASKGIEETILRCRQEVEKWLIGHL